MQSNSLGVQFYAGFLIWRRGGNRTPGTGFSQYNGLANLATLLNRSENFGLYYIPQQLTTNRC